MPPLLPGPAPRLPAKSHSVAPRLQPERSSPRKRSPADRSNRRRRSFWLHLAVGCRLPRSARGPTRPSQAPAARASSSSRVLGAVSAVVVSTQAMGRSTDLGGLWAGSRLERSTAWPKTRSELGVLPAVWRAVWPGLASLSSGLGLSAAAPVLPGE